MTIMPMLNATMNSTSMVEGGCVKDPPQLYPSIIGIDLAVPQLEALITTLILSMIIIVTIVGNVLVILSVFTYKPLRIVQNFFIVSLAVADLTVAILVLPLNVAYSILGRWEFGIHLCKMWLTSDVLCCTASILNLCAIALDRFWAITDPINYAQKRTVERVLYLIIGVWLLSLLISSPPLIGWNDWPDEFTSETPCQLTANPGYVIYSSLGSFFIPLVIMTIVYIEIFIATRRRLRERAQASKAHAMQLKSNINTKECTEVRERESISSETNHNGEHPGSSDSGNSKEAKKKKKDKKKMAKDSVRDKKDKQYLTTQVSADNSITDIQDNNENDIDHKVVERDVEKSLKSEKHVAKVVPKKPSSGVYQFIEEKQKISLSKERRAARTLGIIMSVFIICWLPFFLMYVILPFCSTCCPSEKLINFITWLGYMNSALNPIIYTIFNYDYRRAFKKLLGIKQ